MPPLILIKHRQEREFMRVGFAARLEEGETLAQVLALQILRDPESDAPTDGTAEFRSGEQPAVVDSGQTGVEFWLQAAIQAEDQDEDATWGVYCRVRTSTTRDLVCYDEDGKLPRLIVLGDGAPAG